MLRMAPVPAGDFLDAVAARGGLDDRLLDAIADAVALHAALPPLPGLDAPAALRRVLEGNAAAALAAGLPAPRIEAWRRRRAAGRRLAPCWRRAPRPAGCGAAMATCISAICACWQGAPVPFDALEFDEALATIDTGYDLAFLLMDLDHRVGRPRRTGC